MWGLVDDEEDEELELDEEEEELELDEGEDRDAVDSEVVNKRKEGEEGGRGEAEFVDEVGEREGERESEMEAEVEAEVEVRELGFEFVVNSFMAL